MNKFCWIDLETTGLDSQKNHILEIACVITDEKLNELEVYTTPIWASPSILSKMDGWCTDTHTKSGLLTAVREAGVSLAEVEIEMTKLLRRHFPVSKPPMAGSSVHFDKAFVAAHLPSVAGKFHYRIIDVSSFMLALNYYHNIELFKTGTETAHRALQDVRWSISCLKQYLEKFKA